MTKGLSCRCGLQTNPRFSVVEVKGIDLVRGRCRWVPGCRAELARLGSPICRWRLARG